MKPLILGAGLFLSIAVFPLSSVLAQGGKGLTRYAETFQKSTNVAVVVGVEQYDEVSSGVSRLKYAADDAVKLATVLQQNHYAVKRLTDHQAGKHQILAAIEDAGRNIDRENGTLVFSFSGHGFAKNGQNYLMSSGATTARLQQSALPLNTVIAALRKTRAKRIVVFIDACRDIPGQKSISKGFVQQGGEGIQILFSTRFGSISWESPKLRQGVFSYYLAKGLQGEASRNDQIVEFSELAQYVEKNVRKWTFQNLNRTQQPLRRSSGEFYGPFVMAAKGNYRVNGAEVQNQQHNQQHQQRQQKLARQRAEAERLRQQQAAQQRQQQVAAQQQAAAQKRRQQLALQQQQARQQAAQQRRQQLAQQQAAAQRQRQQATQNQPQQTPQTTGGRFIEPQMVRIRGGSFMMGSPAHEKGRDADETQHPVSVGDFWIGKSEVTFAEWDACVADGGCSHRLGDEGWGRGQRPVINVSWNDANQYARWLSGKTGRNYRLPTEAEWEYAARAGSQTAYPWGDSINCHQADYNFTACNSRGTSPVRSYAANRWGLHDTVGNVWEWTCSTYVKAYNGSEQRCGGGSGFRVLRGGSWYDRPWLVRSAYRYGNYPTLRNYDVGFRLSRTP